MKKRFVYIATLFVLVFVCVPARAAMPPPQSPINTETNARARTNESELPPHDKDISNPRPYQPLLEDNCEESDSPCVPARPVNEESTKRFSREEIRRRFNVALTERLKNVRTETEARRELGDERVDEVLRERIQASLDRAIERFEAALLRLSGLADRLEERLVEFEERGFDMTPAFEELDRARSAIADASVKVADIALESHGVLISETPQGARTRAYESLKEARELLRDAREGLVDALQRARTSLTTAPSAEN